MIANRQPAAHPQAHLRLRAAWRMHSRRNAGIAPTGIGGVRNAFAVAVLQ
jgi:hypothetical protein